MDEKQPLISIIMPVYNAELYIEAAISAIVAQTFTDWELILVNDASGDRSGSICDDWSSKDERIKVRHLISNRGAGAARNIGIDMSCGRYITFVDSDDTIDKELYEIATQYISTDEAGKNIPDMVLWGLTEEYYDEKGNHTGSNVLSLEDAVYDTPEQVRRKVIRLEDKTLFGYQWNHLYRSDIIKDNNIRFESVVLYEDYFFNLKVIEHVNTMRVCSCSGYHYSKRGTGNITSRFIPEYYILSRRRVESMYNAYRDWKMYTPEVKNSCGQRLVRYIMSALIRNCAPSSDMSHIDRRRWVKKLYKDKLYKMVSKHCYIEQVPLRMLRGLINRHCTSLILIMGRMLYMVKEGLPGLFAKKKQIH